MYDRVVEKKTGRTIQLLQREANLHLSVYAITYGHISKCF